MGTLVRLYVGWRLLRLLRPLMSLTAIGAVVLAMHSGHVAAKGAASSALIRGAAAAQRALEHAFTSSRR